MNKKILNFVPMLFVLNIFYILYISIRTDYSMLIIKEALTWILPYSLGLNISLIFIFFVLNINTFKKYLIIEKRYLFWLFLILILGLSLRLMAPQTHRLFFDEDIYINIGQNILQEGKSILCNRGEKDKCFEYILNKQPQGFPFLLSLVFWVFGIYEINAFAFTFTISILSIILIFWVTALLFDNKKYGLLSALILSLTPVHILWSRTTSAEPTFLFFTLLSMLFFLLFVKNGKITSFFLFILTLSFTTQFRPEAPILLFIFFIFLIALKRNWLDFIFTGEFITGLIVLLLFIFPTMIQLKVSAETDNWGAIGPTFGFQYAEANFIDNFSFFFENTRWPVVYTILAIIGLFTGLLERNKKTMAVFFWFLLFFLVYMFFYAGSFNYGVDIRFAINLFPPLIVLMCFGVKFILSISPKTMNILVILMILSFLPFFKYATEVGPKAPGARYQHEFVYSLKDQIPKNCYVMTHIPSLFLPLGINSMQTWFGQNPSVMDYVFSKTDCVLFFEGYWCGTEPYKSGVCKYMHDHYTLAVWKRAPDVVEGRSYTFYFVRRS